MFLHVECPRNCEQCSSGGACNNVGDRCREHYVWDDVDKLCVGKTLTRRWRSGDQKR